VEAGKEVPVKQAFSESKTIGVDFEITDFALFQLKKRLKILSTRRTLQRYDFQHKLSFQLVSENRAIAVKNLNVKGIIMNHYSSQAIGDSTWSSFVTKLEDTSEWLGKTILMIDKFESSSKICHVFGYHNSELTLKD
jgi:putative transposase